MHKRQLSSTDKPIPFLMVNSADGKTGAVGLSPVVTLQKNGMPPTPAKGAVTPGAKGVYWLQPHADDRDTLGSFVLHAEAVGADDTDEFGEIVEYNPFASPGTQNPDPNLVALLGVGEEIRDLFKVFFNDSVPLQHRVQ